MKKSTKIFLSIGTTTAIAGAILIPTIYSIVNKDDGTIGVINDNYVYALKNKKHALKKVESVYKDDKNKHYFMIMLDSLSSERFYDSYFKMVSDFKSPKYQIGKKVDGHEVTIHDRKIMKDKIEALNGFNLKMNVVSPGYNTSSGLQGVVGGSFGAVTTSEFLRKGPNRVTQLNDAYEQMLESVGSSDSIDKIYFDDAEFFKTRNIQKDRWNSHWNISDLNISDKAKNKITIDNLHTSSTASWPTLNETIEAINVVKKDENNFTYLSTNIIHDEHKEWHYKNNYFNPASNDVFSLLSNIYKTLKEKDMWSDSEIMIVSDHGKYAEKWKTEPKGLFPQLESARSEIVDYLKTSATGKLNDEISFSKISKKASPFEHRIMAPHASILYKPRNHQNISMTRDYNNLYGNFDAISQLYYDIGVDPYFIEFNYYKYTKNFENHINTNGDFNSYVENPFNKDLSNRRLIAFDPNQWTWGYLKSLWLANSGTFYKGPWLSNENDEIHYNSQKIMRLELDSQPNRKRTDDNKPWLDKRREEAISIGLEKSSDPTEGLNVLGDLFYSLNEYFKNKK